MGGRFEREVQRCGSGGLTKPTSRQVLLREPHGHRTLADGGRDSLDRIRPDVAGGEHARQAGLEGERQTLQRPGSWQVRRRRCPAR